MGLRDRIKQKLRSPMTVTMKDLGTETHVRAGARARVLVRVDGEDDGTVERIDLHLRMIGWGNEQVVKWPLGEVPVAAGTHEVDVAIPGGLAPSVKTYADYAVVAHLRRVGAGSAAAVPLTLDVREEDLYWPEDLGDGPVVEADVVRAGGTVRGRADGPVQVGYEFTVPDHSDGKPRYPPDVFWRPLAEVDGPAFAVDIPADVMPTFHNGGHTSVTWQVRSGDTFRVFAVLR